MFITKMIELGFWIFLFIPVKMAEITMEAIGMGENDPKAPIGAIIGTFIFISYGLLFVAAVCGLGYFLITLI